MFCAFFALRIYDATIRLNDIFPNKKERRLLVLRGQPDKLCPINLFMTCLFTYKTVKFLHLNVKENDFSDIEACLDSNCTCFEGFFISLKYNFIWS